MKKRTKFLICLSIFLMLILPIFASAKLVPCSNTPDPDTGEITDPCDFPAIMKLVDNILNFILKDMVLPIAAIMFAYAGFTLITAGTASDTARSKAKSIFWSTLLGLAIAMAAWLLVKLILTILGFTGPGLV
jgi:hypothetical protein